MSNPFVSPQSPIGNSDCRASWTTREVFRIALIATASAIVVGGLIHVSLGLSWIDILLENQFWQLLLFSAGVLLLWIPSRFSSSTLLVDYARVLRCSIGLGGILVLVFHGINMFDVYQSITPRSRMLSFVRVFGDHIWYYLVAISVVGLFPSLLVWPKFQMLDRVAIPISVLLIPSTTFFLRANFLMNYSDEIPSSWYQFYWPF